LPILKRHLKDISNQEKFQNLADSATSEVMSSSCPANTYILLVYYHILNQLPESDY